MKDYWALKLWEHLKQLTSKEWIVEPELNKWDLRFRCRLGDFRYNTEWFDTEKINVSQIELEAEVITMWYQRKKGMV